jgi:polyphosphate glucokinase
MSINASPEMGEPTASSAPATLCIDVGGSAIKGGTIGPDGTLMAERVRFPTPLPLAPDTLIELIVSIARQSPPAARVAVGFPGMVRSGVVFSAPNLVRLGGVGNEVVPEMAAAWDHFPLADRITARLGIAARVGNDADVQGLAAIQGVGLEVVVTLGTGMGLALFRDGVLAPHLELGHHPLLKGKTYDELLGDRARRKVGNSKWSARVDRAVGVIATLTFYDTLYLGGGNAPKLTKAFTEKATIVDNADGILGGVRLWSLAKIP